MTIALGLELALTLLLAATLFYCAILERRLAALRKGQDGFRKTVAELNAAIAAAGSSLRMLKATTADAAESLDGRLAKARGVIDELSLLASSGERIAERIERGVAVQSDRSKSPADRVTPPVLANRLDALKPQILRGDAPRQAVAGNVR